MDFVAVVLSMLALNGATTTVWAVGDGAVAGSEDEAVAQRIEQEGLDHFIYLGDVYETGTAKEFAEHYHPSFGRFKDITSPTPGNHEYPNRHEGYDPYWGSRVRQPEGGRYFSHDLAGWHLVSLNSMDVDGGQRAWLAGDLARYGGTCTIAFWHAPRYNAGEHGEAVHMEPLYELLEGRATIVLTGHDHNYQRFLPFRGITQFVVGTGGRDLYSVNESDRRLGAANDSVFGALRLELGSMSASFEFVRSDGTRLDRGSIPCEPHAPRVSITRPRSGRTYSRGLRTLKGTARGATGPVRATLVRSGGGKSSYTATGTTSWRVTLRSGLRRGSYRFSVRARDGAGRLGSTKVGFRIR
jgi:hypothetical protein